MAISLFIEIHLNYQPQKLEHRVTSPIVRRMVCLLSLASNTNALIPLGFLAVAGVARTRKPGALLSRMKICSLSDGQVSRVNLFYSQFRHSREGGNPECTRFPPSREWRQFNNLPSEQIHPGQVSRSINPAVSSWDTRRSGASAFFDLAIIYPMIPCSHFYSILANINQHMDCSIVQCIFVKLLIIDDRNNAIQHWKIHGSSDLKSAASWITGVPVRSRSRAPVLDSSLRIQ